MRELSLLPLATLRSKRDADMHLSRQVLDPQIRQFALMNLAEERQSSGFSRLYWRVNLDAIVRHLPTIAGAEVREQGLKLQNVEHDEPFPFSSLSLPNTNTFRLLLLLLFR